MQIHSVVIQLHVHVTLSHGLLSCLYSKTTRNDANYYIRIYIHVVVQTVNQSTVVWICTCIYILIRILTHGSSFTVADDAGARAGTN